MTNEQTSRGPAAVAQARSSESASLETIRAQAAELLDEAPGAFGDDENLIDRGLDSIRIMSLVEQWHRYGVEVTFVELAERPTVAAWWQLASSRLPTSSEGGTSA